MAMTSEVKLANQIVKHLNMIDCDPVKAAAFMSMASPEIKVKLSKFVMKLLYNWAIDFEEGNYQPCSEYEGVVVNAKRIVENFGLGAGTFGE